MHSRSIYFKILLYMVAPILSALIASGIAAATGSRLDEAGAHPCIIMGCDIGVLLSIMFAAGWLVLLTVPTGLIAILVAINVRRFRNRKAKNP
jgi:hypothetical protein